MRELLERIGGHTVLVIGDLYLDHYIFGSPQRISREAPVMVLDEGHQEYRLGGAGAPALSLRKLGCQVAIAGAVGDDPEGREILRLMEDAGIDASFITADPSRPTTKKTRIVAEGFLLFPQQLVRVDRQERSAIASNVEASIVQAIRSVDGDSVLVSDYRSGVVTEALVRAIHDFQKVRGALSTVDSQGELVKFAGFDLVKCNQAEAESTIGSGIADERFRQEKLAALRDELGSECLVVTRGGEGASVVTEDDYAEVPATNRTEIYDVTGAGDTVVAVMTAALLAGGTPVQSATLAQVAAGIVVRKWGNAQASRPEIAAALGAAKKKE